MPSKKKNRGNPVVVLRLPPEMLEWIDACVKRSMMTARNEPYDRSSFIRASLKERYDKYRRNKKSQDKKRLARAARASSSTSSAPAPTPDLVDGDQVEHVAADLATPPTE